MCVHAGFGLCVNIKDQWGEVKSEGKATLKNQYLPATHACMRAHTQKQKFRMRKQAKQRNRIEKTQIKVKQRRRRRLGLLYERWNEALAFTWTSSTVNALFSQLIPKVSRSICSASISLLSQTPARPPSPINSSPPASLRSLTQHQVDNGGIELLPFSSSSARSFIERSAATSSQQLEVCLCRRAEDRRTCRLTGLFWKKHDK